MGAIIVDEAGYKEYQRKTDEALKDVESLKNRWSSLFKAMTELIEEASNRLKFIEQYEGEDWVERDEGFWCGVRYAMERLYDNTADCPLIEIDDEIWEMVKPKVDTMSMALKGWVEDVLKSKNRFGVDNGEES